MPKCSFSTPWPRQPNPTYFSALSIAALHRRERTALTGPRCTDVPQQAASATLNGLGVQAKGHQERAHAQYAAHLRRLDEPARYEQVDAALYKKFEEEVPNAPPIQQHENDLVNKSLVFGDDSKSSAKFKRIKVSEREAPF